MDFHSRFSCLSFIYHEGRRDGAKFTYKRCLRFRHEEDFINILVGATNGRPWESDALPYDKKDRERKNSLPFSVTALFQFHVPVVEEAS